jgi:hypothetical protein
MKKITALILTAFCCAVLNAQIDTSRKNDNIRLPEDFKELVIINDSLLRAVVERELDINQPKRRGTIRIARKDEAPEYVIANSIGPGKLFKTEADFYKWLAANYPEKTYPGAAQSFEKYALTWDKLWDRLSPQQKRYFNNDPKVYKSKSITEKIEITEKANKAFNEYFRKKFAEVSPGAYNIETLQELIFLSNYRDIDYENIPKIFEIASNVSLKKTDKLGDLWMLYQMIPMDKQDNYVKSVYRELKNNRPLPPLPEIGEMEDLNRHFSEQAFAAAEMVIKQLPGELPEYLKGKKAGDRAIAFYRSSEFRKLCIPAYSFELVGLNDNGVPGRGMASWNFAKKKMYFRIQPFMEFLIQNKIPPQKVAYDPVLKTKLLAYLAPIFIHETEHIMQTVRTMALFEPDSQFYGVIKQCGISSDGVIYSEKCAGTYNSYNEENAFFRQASFYIEDSGNNKNFIFTKNTKFYESIFTNPRGFIPEHVNKVYQLPLPDKTYVKNAEEFPGLKEYLQWLEDEHEESIKALPDDRTLP